QRHRIVIDDRNARVAVGLAFERRMSRDHFIKHNSETKHVRALVDAFTQRLFGRHVAGRAHDRSRTRLSNRNRHGFGIRSYWFAISEFRESKVEHLYEAIAHKLVLPQHDVLGFYIAVNDAFGVRRFESHGHLNTDAKHLVKLHWTTPETVTQRFAFDVLGGDVIAVGSLADLVNGEDVWMIERENSASFLF